MKNNKYIEIRNKYLAQGLSFLGYRYFKFGQGKDTIYSFKNENNIEDSINHLLKLKKEINLN
ncbi:hypothetical protein NRP93_000542 [Clostridium botulinum]|nr:hypothetical protein [Clostridium botulinum]